MRWYGRATSSSRRARKSKYSPFFRCTVRCGSGTCRQSRSGITSPSSCRTKERSSGIAYRKTRFFGSFSEARTASTMRSEADAEICARTGSSRRRSRSRRSITARKSASVSSRRSPALISALRVTRTTAVSSVLPFGKRSAAKARTSSAVGISLTAPSAGRTKHFGSRVVGTRPIARSFPRPSSAITYCSLLRRNGSGRPCAIVCGASSGMSSRNFCSARAWSSGVRCSASSSSTPPARSADRAARYCASSSGICAAVSSAIADSCSFGVMPVSLSPRFGRQAARSSRPPTRTM